MVKRKPPEEHKKAINATGPKQNVINKVFKHCGIKPSKYDHGFKRGVYLAMMYENGCEFLRNEIDEKDLKLKQKFQDDMSYTQINGGRRKQLEDIKICVTKTGLNQNNYFYWDIIDLSWEDTHKKYINEVGR